MQTLALSRRATFAVALAPALGIVQRAAAQNAPPRTWSYSRAYRVAPGKRAEYEAFATGTIRKLHEALKANGIETGFLLARLVFPAGEDAPYSYVHNSVFSQRPELDVDYTTGPRGEAMKQTGMTYAQFTAKLRELATLVRTSVTMRIDGIGVIEKGDLLRVDYMKVPQSHFSEYVAAERTIYKPIHQALVERGAIKSWSLVGVSLPGGTDRPYDFYTTQAVKPGAPAGMGGAELFSKMHPDRNYVATMNRQAELRTLVRQHVFRIKDMLS